MNPRVRYLLLAVFVVSLEVAAADSISLVERDPLPPTESAALIAAAQKVADFGHDPQGFRAIISCDDEFCQVDVFPEELETEEYKSYRGCPLKYCATMIYSIVSGKIEETTLWR